MQNGYRKGSASVFEIVILLLIIAGLFFAYRAYNNSKRDESTEYAESPAKTDEQIEIEKEDAAREREKQERQEKERKEAEKKRLQAEAAEHRRQLAEKERCRAEYASVRKKFKDCKAKIWDDENPENLPALESAGVTYYCVFNSYDVDHLFYCISVNEGNASCVKSLDGITTPKSVSADVFFNRYNNEKCAVLTEGVIWLRGLPKNSSRYDIPSAGHEFVAASTECGNFYDVLSGLGVNFGDKRYRLTLQSSDGRQSTVVGIFGYDEAVARKDILSIVSTSMAKLRKDVSAGSTNIGKPKLKKYKPSVVFYDGTLITKDANGVTRVPREFTFRGTANYKTYDTRVVNEARRKWEDLRDEAMRQEKLAAETELANRKIMEEYDRKSKQASVKRSKAATVSPSDVENTIRNWQILVERSRGKRKAN